MPQAFEASLGEKTTSSKWRWWVHIAWPPWRSSENQRSANTIWGPGRAARGMENLRVPSCSGEQHRSGDAHVVSALECEASELSDSSAFVCAASMSTAACIRRFAEAALLGRAYGQRGTPSLRHTCLSEVREMPSRSAASVWGLPKRDATPW